MKAMKNSAAGLDGWGRSELRKLPLQAWESLLYCLKQPQSDIYSTPSSLVKRVMLEKGSAELPTADAFRPLDIYSMILRVYTSTQTERLAQWKKNITHPSQYATHGGTQRALSRIAYHTESVLQGFGGTKVVGLSVDFSKLYNTVSPIVAARAAVYAGLTPSDAHDLLTPLIATRHVYRLPDNTVCPFVSKERGLAQGLSSSVLLAELFVALVVWRIDKSVRAEAICYIDDLNFVTQGSAEMDIVLSILRDFESTFFLNISDEKSYLWGNQVEALAYLSDKWGIPLRDHVSCLGADWPTIPSSVPAYSKEEGRRKEAVKRLIRLSHLPASLPNKLAVVSIGCMSLLTYMPTFDHKAYTDLRKYVRRAIGVQVGAPEVILYTLTERVVDPMCVWFMSMFKLWHLCANQPDAKYLLECIHEGRRQSRFSALKRLARKLGIVLTHDRIFSEAFELRLGRTWESLKFFLLPHFRKHMIASLALRRPMLYEGLEDVSVKRHKALLKSLNTYDASVLVRIWSGVALTLAHSTPLTRMCHHFALVVEGCRTWRTWFIAVAFDQSLAYP